MMAGVFSSVMASIGASARVFQLIDRIPKLPPSGELRPLKDKAGAELVFFDVHFAYPSRPTTRILNGISLTVRAGQRVALVGPSGGGKSTIILLAERFYDPSLGRILFDGVPLPSVACDYLHSQVALVSQEPVLFAASVFDNIAFGRNHLSVSREEVEAAAQLANAHDFITALPQGYRTQGGHPPLTRPFISIIGCPCLTFVGCRVPLLSPSSGGAGRPVVGRAAPEDRYRARLPPASPPASSRRGHLSARRRVRSAGVGGA